MAPIWPQHDPGRGSRQGPLQPLPVPWPHEIWTRSSKAEELRGWDLGEHERTKINYGTAFTGSVTGQLTCSLSLFYFLAKPFHGLL